VNDQGNDTGQLNGAAVLAALEARGDLFCFPADVAAVLGRNLKTIYPALERGEIPHTRVGQRYSIPVAWLRRQADGLDDRQPTGAGLDDVDPGSRHKPGPSLQRRTGRQRHTSGGRQLAQRGRGAA
jgi:excisionase family DNA binding protein